MMARNFWFQRRAIPALQLLAESNRLPERPVVFAYSYAALEIFRFAKSCGWTTVLGQIDPGKEEENLIQ
ncbi:MAG: glycosyltransferase, partial [Verrucomicrobiota bacterium]